MNYEKFFITFICSIGFFGCCETKTEEEIDIHTQYKNKTHYEITIGDTVSIYDFWNGSVIYRTLDKARKLPHVKYLNSKTISSVFECEGCTNISADKFISTSKGKDTIVYLTLYHGDSTILDRDTFFITVK